MLLEKATLNAEALRTAGRRAIAQAKANGVPVYYIDTGLSDDIIRELPDGTRQRVRVEADRDIVLGTISPAI